MVHRLKLLLTGFAGPPLGRRILQASLLFGGLSMVAIGAVFLLGSSWNEGPRRSAAAGELPNSTSVRFEAGLSGRTLGTRAALARLNQSSLVGGFIQLAFPKFTATPTLTPTATPTPQPAPVVVAEEPAAELPASQPSNLPDESSCPTASMLGFAADLFGAINNERSQAGLPGLSANGCVIHVAYLRSEDMASSNYFSHSSPGGDTAFSLMDDNDVHYGWAGENLARNNYPDSETVAVSIRDLMASQGHRENILSTNYTQMGVGFAEDGAGMKYYTMIFIGPP